MIKLFGTDPEFLLKNMDTNEYESSIDYIPGSKKEPLNLVELGEGYSIQRDNVLAEFCVPPVKNFNDLWESIQTAKKYAEDKFLPSNVKLVAETGTRYSDDILSHPEAQEFGCSESFNAWTEDINPKPEATSNYRGAGFHIHLSVGPENQDADTLYSIIKHLDLFVGVLSVICDKDNTRRETYGRAGECRFTNYGGVEYRVLPSSMLKNKETFNMVAKGVERALAEIEKGGIKFSWELSAKIQTCINTHNLKLAHELVRDYNMDNILEEVFYID